MLSIVVAVVIPLSAPAWNCKTALDPQKQHQKTVAWVDQQKQIAFKIMVDGSQKASRTIALGRRFLAPISLGDREISNLGEDNFQKTARYVLDHLDQLDVNKETAIRLNKMLTKGLVPEKERGNYLYRQEGSYGYQTDDFVKGNPKIFYHWLDSKTAKELAIHDPVTLAEIIHNNIVALDSFPDGNGRLSRVFADMVLLKAGLAPAYYTDMSDYFKRGTPRGIQGVSIPASRASRVEYFREIVENGQRAMNLDSCTLSDFH